MKRLWIPIVVLAALFIFGAPRLASDPDKPGLGGKNVKMEEEAYGALREFATGIGEGDPNRQMDASVLIVDRLDAAGKYSTRFSIYNIKNVFKGGDLEGLLIKGDFRVESDIEELNSSNAMTIYIGPDGSNFAIVNGEKTEPHSDFMFFVAATRMPEKVAAIDYIYIKSAEKRIEEGNTEYTMVFEGEGLHNSPDLFNFFVMSTFREEAVKFEIGDIEYTFSFDENGTPMAACIIVSVNPIDEEGDIAYINAQITIAYNSFEDVRIEKPTF